MAVFVDHSCLAWRGKSWCHMVADSVTELHDFAEQLGLKRAWFQDRTLYPHYDVTVSIRRKALALGALPGDKETIVSRAKSLRNELMLERLAERTLVEIQEVESASCGLAINPAQQSLFATHLASR